LESNSSDEIPIPLCNDTGAFNITMPNIPPRDNTVTVFVNDTFGYTVNDSQDFIVNQVNYTNPVVESFTNNITIRLFGLGVSPTNPVINYESVDYTMTITSEGNETFLLRKGFEAPIDDNRADFYFTWDSQKTVSYNQTVNPISLGICNSTVNLTSPILTFYTRNIEYPRALINTTLVFTFTYGIGSAGEKTYTYEDLTQDNSTYKFCTINESLEFFGNMVVIAGGSGYDSLTNYYPTVNFTTAIPKNYTLYLSVNGSTTPTAISLVSDSGLPQQGLGIVLQRYYGDLDAFIEVGSGETSVLGEDIFYMKWYDTLYRVIFSNSDGTIELATGSFKVRESPTQFILPFELVNEYDHFDNLAYSLTFNNVTNQFTLTYADATGQISEGCLLITKNGVMNSTRISNQCIASHSATLYYIVNTTNTGNGTYLASFIASGSPNRIVIQIWAQIGEIYGDLTLAFQTALGDIGMVWVSIIIIGTVAFSALISPVLAIIMTIVGIIIAVVSGMLPLGIATTTTIAVGGLLIIWGIRK